MVRVVLGFSCLAAVMVLSGCEGMYDCEEACQLLRDCGMAHGTARDVCEVRCAENEDTYENAVDACGACLDDQACSESCLHDCVCSLSLDTTEYPGVSCSL